MNELQPNNPEMGVKDFLAVLRRRAWLIVPVILLCLAGAYEWTLHTPKTWRAEAQVEMVRSTVPAADSPLAGVQSQGDESMETQMGLIQSNKMAERTISNLKATALINKGSSDTVTWTPAEVGAAVKVTNPTDSSLLDITADADSYDKAWRLADAVAKAFRDWKQELARTSIIASIYTLQKTVDTAQTSLVDAEAKETSFKQAHHLADINAEQTLAIEQLGGSDTSVIALRQELSSRKSAVRDLDAQLRAADVAVSSADGVPDASLVQSLQVQLGQLKIDRTEAGTKYNYNFPGAPNMPTLASLDAQIKAKQSQYDHALKASTNHAAPSLSAHSAISAADADAHVQMNLTQAKLAEALQAQQAYQQRVQAMPSLQQQYAQLHRDRELAERIATSYQAALSATKLQLDQIPNSVIVTQGGIASNDPYKPNLKTNMILGLALGALLSLGLVLLLEQVDQRVRTLDEVRALVSGPIIGMLPRTSRSQMKALTQGRLLPQVEEAFSLVQINLSYVMRHAMMRSQTDHQIILVTSAMPGEGKSVAAAELARSMAESGKSVILVNANLRQPSQNALFQTGEAGGLTDVLSGQLPLDEAIATSNVQNLSVLNSGLSYENPTVLLSQPRLASVMEELRYKADVVIIDGPDCTLAADTLLLTAHADCLMQVVRAGAVDMETLHNASLALHSTGKKVTVLVNGLTGSQQRAFKMRFAYAALSSQTETPALPQTFEKTMVMNRSRDLVFSKSVNKTLEIPEGTPEKNDES